MGNPDFFAPLILFSLFPTLSFMIQYYESKKFALSSIFTAMALIQLAALVASMTRGSWIGVFLGGIFFCAILFFYVFREKGNRKVFAHMLLALFAISAISILFSMIFIPKFAPFFAGKINSILTMEQKDYYSGQVIPLERPYLWRDTIVFFWDYLKNGHILGIGPENFHKFFMPFKSLELSQIAFDKFFDNPHNLYLSILCATGIPGLFSFLMLMIFMFINLFRALGKEGDNHQRLIIAGLASSLFAYAINLIFTSEVLQMALFFFVFVGIMQIFAKHSDDISASYVPGRKSKIIFAVILVLPALVAIAGIADLSRQVVADYRLRKGLQALNSKPPDVEKAIKLFLSSCHTYPRESFYTDELLRALGTKSSELMVANKIEDAEKYYQMSLGILENFEASSKSPPILYMGTGLNSYRVGYIDNAIALFEKALLWDKWNTRARSAVANFYFLRYSVAGEQNDLIMAFNHSFATVNVLKYFPLSDLNTFRNCAAFANEIYKMDKQDVILGPLSETLMAYAKFAKADKETAELYADALKNCSGTKYEDQMRAACYFYRFKSGLLTPDETLVIIRGLKLNDNYIVKDYIKLIEKAKVTRNDEAGTKH